MKNITSTSIQNLIDASGSYIAVLSKEQKILYVNRAWRDFASLAGVSVEQSYIGSTYPHVCLGAASSSSRDAGMIDAGIKGVIALSEIEFEMEYLCTATAEPMWVRVHAASFSLNADDDNEMVLVSHDNVTEEKLAKALLTTDRQRVDRLLDSTRIVPWEGQASSGVCTFISDRVEQIFGYPKRMWFEPHFWINHLHPDDRERVSAEFARFAQNPGQYQYEYRMLGLHGGVIWVSDCLTVQAENGRPTTIGGYMTDITERKQAEETLLLLSGRLITAQEDERKRIARELHDDLNQRMALMSIELEQLGQSLPNRKDGLGERIKELQRKAMRISQEIHRMSYKLHPSKLDHLGLVPALKSFCAELAERRRIKISFEHEGDSFSLPDEVTLCLFRIAQEALQNSAKHSGGSHADVTLNISETAVDLVISDAGCGFDTRKGKINEGLGFISMRERLRLVGGHLMIHSEPFCGTQINVFVPLRRDRSKS